ncbi:Hypothetical protein CINCED_3A019180 [Cinara cedri]|uniref:Uncharacterized protein n=1 Tax=Cinara cedri TaxID=506608 RepID=A0A5E4MH19_9HEMI|nr:Hypothetical protein CINCED_3A019180 [Cinara cedri]
MPNRRSQATSPRPPLPANSPRPLSQTNINVATVAAVAAILARGRNFYEHENSRPPVTNEERVPPVNVTMRREAHIIIFIILSYHHGHLRLAPPLPVSHDHYANEQIFRIFEQFPGIRRGRVHVRHDRIIFDREQLPFANAPALPASRDYFLRARRQAIRRKRLVRRQEREPFFDDNICR